MKSSQIRPITSSPCSVTNFKTRHLIGDRNLQTSDFIGKFNNETKDKSIDVIGGIDKTTKNVIGENDESKDVIGQFDNTTRDMIGDKDIESMAVIGQFDNTKRDMIGDKDIESKAVIGQFDNESRVTIGEEDKPGKMVCSDWLRREFINKDDEMLYKKYFRRERQDGLLVLLVSAIIYTILLLLVDVITLILNGDISTLWIARVASLSSLVVLSTGILCAYACNKPLVARPATLHLSWFAFLAAVLVEAGCRAGAAPWEGVCGVAMVILLTFLCLPAKLAICCVLSFVACVLHILLQCLLHLYHPDADAQFVLLNMVGANILLFTGAAILGALSYINFDTEHRKCFLQIKSSLIVNSKVQQCHMEQERLLLSVLPRHVAMEMIEDWGSMVDGQFRKIYMGRYENVSILFADIVGFTAISSNCTAGELVKILNQLFASFDKLANRLHQLRIKILGDCYYCVCGAPEPRPQHASLSIYMGLGMVDAIKSVAMETGKDVNMRVGIHTGAVLGGVLGLKQWQFDVLGKEVTLANKMESSGVPGRVHISHKTKDCLNGEFELEDGNGHLRDELLATNDIHTFLVKRVLIPLKIDDEGESGVVKQRQRESEELDTKSWIKDNLHEKMEEMVLHRPHFSCKLKMSVLTLRFYDNVIEKTYSNRVVVGSGRNMIGLSCVAVFTFLSRFCVLPRTLLAVLVFVFVCFWMVVVTVITWRPMSKKMDVRHDSALISIVQSRAFISVVTLTSCCLAFFSSLSLMFDCDSDATYNISYRSDLDPADPHLDPADPHCFYSVYFLYSAVVVLAAITHLTHIGHMTKAAFLLVGVCVTCLLWTLSLPPTTYNQGSYITGGFWRYRVCVLVVACGLILMVINRKMEKVNRCLFAWSLEMKKKEEDLTTIKHKSDALIKNILPPHVVMDFIGQCKKDEELYSQSHSHVGVMFVSCPHFHDFYSESSINNDGMECLRFLNEIISDFDELLDKKRFSNITKIKTIGLTYMVASGMTDSTPNHTEDMKERWKHLADLMEFAFMMKKTLIKINQQSFNNFLLRIGINHGPVIAGVIGAKKPHYDIWGNTVNVASRMESTGQLNKIQVVKETKEILELFGYSFVKRGVIKVKGKGDLITFFTEEPQQGTSLLPNQIL